ncbi:MAG: ATP/GTP-binding protein [Acidimicrobiia bacterium]
MTSRLTDRPASSDGTLATRPLKIVVAGGFAAGKTTLVESISEITPLTTEAPMTSLSVGVDNSGEIRTKTTTTVAMDFGRITLGTETMLYLFGTPGQDRFWFMWDELVRGAVGAVVVVDSRRLSDCFSALDFFDEHRVPYVVTVNCFDGKLHHPIEDIEDALSMDPAVPLLAADLRKRAETKQVLIELVKHAISKKASV